MDDMAAIMPAAKIRKCQDNTKLDKIMRGIMDNIYKASRQGRRSCTLPETTETQGYDYAIRQSLINAGYEIRPYGVNGGVWQDIKLICW